MLGGPPRPDGPNPPPPAGVVFVPHSRRGYVRISGAERQSFTVQQHRELGARPIRICIRLAKVLRAAHLGFQGNCALGDAGHHRFNVVAVVEVSPHLAVVGRALERQGQLGNSLTSRIGT